MGRYDGFREFVQGSGPALSRTAYLLCGDRGLAEDLLQTALTKTVARWPQVHRGGNPRAYVRRVMINERTSRWRRRRYREHLTATPPERGGAVDETDRAAWRLSLADALAKLPDAAPLIPDPDRLIDRDRRRRCRVVVGAPVAAGLAVLVATRSWTCHAPGRCC